MVELHPQVSCEYKNSTKLNRNQEKHSMATNWLMELLGSTGHLIIICEFCATDPLYQKNLHLYMHLHTHTFFFF